MSPGRGGGDHEDALAHRGALRGLVQHGELDAVAPRRHREAPGEDGVAPPERLQVRLGHLDRRVLAEVLADDAPCVAHHGEDGEVGRARPAPSLEPEPPEGDLRHERMADPATLRAEVVGAGVRLEVPGGGRGLEGPEERQLPREVDGALARREGEVALARLEGDPRPLHLHPDPAEAAVEGGELGVVRDLVVPGEVGEGAVEAGPHVVAVGDEPPARALGEGPEHPLHVQGDRVLRHLGGQDVLARDRPAPPRLDLPADGLHRLPEVAPRVVVVRGGAQPPRVDRVDAEVGAVGLAHHGAVERLQLVGDLEPLGEVDDGLAAREPLLLAGEGEEAEERGVAPLAALEAARHLDRAQLHVRHRRLRRRLAGGSPPAAPPLPAIAASPAAWARALAASAAAVARSVASVPGTTSRGSSTLQARSTAAATASRSGVNCWRSWRRFPMWKTENRRSGRFSVFRSSRAALRAKARPSWSSASKTRVTSVGWRISSGEGPPRARRARPARRRAGPAPARRTGS